MARMIRKQVYLSAAQNARLHRAAARLRRTEADLLREALDRFLEPEPASGGPPDRDPLWDIVGLVDGGDPQASSRVDEVLYGARRR